MNSRPLGPFPHRNAALGRVSSTQELAFLQTPPSRPTPPAAPSLRGRLRQQQRHRLIRQPFAAGDLQVLAPAMPHGVQDWRCH